MEKEEWIAQLGRLYAEISSVEAGTGASGHMDQFNRILSELKKEFPDNEFVQETEEVELDIYKQTNTNQEVKMKCGQLADVLGHDLPKTELESVDELTVISMASQQTAEQTANQELSFEQVNQMVQLAPLDSDRREELDELVEKFEDELDGEQDPNTLRQILRKAEEYSPDVVAKLAMLALQKGATGVLNLG